MGTGPPGVWIKVPRVRPVVNRCSPLASAAACDSAWCTVNGSSIGFSGAGQIRLGASSLVLYAQIAHHPEVETIETYFGQQVKQLRSACGISQEELGFLANLSSSYVSRLERGTTSPTIGVVQKIAKALGVSVSELMRLVDESMPSKAR
jgi:DNA-binding XRE family transcriptional regulator